MATPDADLQAIRTVQAALSPDGMISPAAVELIDKFVAVSDSRVRTAHLDLARIYTNDFAAGK
jgi:hypothetical protein